mmetsp:Transcript_10496/g.19317  ORF Transcript_10496/g.19317 Transcript_10496/m.19317 type:complete len:307 (+) Transcript_10496:59-979(+)
MATESAQAHGRGARRAQGRGSCQEAAPQCSRCGMQGHRAAACSKPFYKVESNLPYNPRSRGQPRQLMKVECYECGEWGHRRAECPQRARIRQAAKVSMEDPAIQAKLEDFSNCYRSLENGYTISEGEREAVNNVGGSDVYGELMPVATLHLLQALDLKSDDVFFDLGCGTGKVVLLTAMFSDVSRAVGLELSETRVNTACEAIARAKLEKRCSIFKEDFLTTPHLRDATVCFGCNYTLPKESFTKLFLRLIEVPRLRLVATLKNPFHQMEETARDEWGAAFKAAGTLRLNCSWAPQVLVYLYRRRE